MIYCPNCGTPNQTEAQLCVNCAKPLPKLAPNGELRPTPATVPPDAPSRPAPGAYPSQPGSQYSYASPAAPYGYAPVYVASGPIQQPASAAARLGAWVIDSIIQSVISSIAFGVPVIFWATSFYNRYQVQLAGTCNSGTRGYSSQRCNQLIETIFSQQSEVSGLIGVIFGGIALGGLACLLYMILLTASGATIGKRIFGLQVVKTDGSKPGFGTATLRQTIGYGLSSVFMLGFIWILFDANRQGWHDKLSSTYVIKTIKPY